MKHLFTGLEPILRDNQSIPIIRLLRQMQELITPLLVSFLVDVWSGNMNITSTYTVEATDLLTITPGSSITFTNNSDFIVNGELIANGVTFDFVTPSNNGIKFNSGSSGTISYSTIKNATTGIWATGSSTSINIHDNVISDNGTGVHLTSTGTNVLITDNVIEDNTIGMWLYQSNASVSGNIIENNTYGMNADYVSTTAEHDGNKVRYNTARGLFLNSSNLWGYRPVCLRETAAIRC